jgi:hypothetical protein
MLADRDATLAGSPSFLAYVAADLDPAVLAAARVEPTFTAADTHSDRRRARAAAIDCGFFLIQYQYR